jgi:hypothetical protein
MLNQQGFFAINAICSGNWMYDKSADRALYLSPHWLTDSSCKAGTIGFGQLKSRTNNVLTRLVGVSGHLTQGVIGYLVSLIQYSYGS